MRGRYVAYSALILVLYGLAAVRGWEIGGGKRGFIPASVRQSPGGYRSYTFWGGGK